MAARPRLSRRGPPAGRPTGRAAAAAAPESTDSAAHPQAAARARRAAARRSARRRRAIAAAALSSTASRTPGAPPAEHVAHDARVEHPVAAAQRLRLDRLDPERRPGRRSSGRPCRRRPPTTLDVVVVVSSSRPSSPRNTSAVSPRARPARAAMTGAIRGSAQPTAAAGTRAGLVSGPRKLKTSATPSSRRGAPGVPHAGVEDRREAETDADLGDGRAPPPSPGRSIDDAELLEHVRRPAADVAARLPCLTTRRPGAGDDQRRHRGDVHGVRAVGAGADDVDRAAARSSTGVGPGRASCGPARRAPRRLALGAQQHGERGELRRGGRRRP